MERTALVLWWKYSDGSGMGVERVYVGDSKRAQEDLDLASRDCAREWKITEVGLFGDDPPKLT